MLTPNGVVLKDDEIIKEYNMGFKNFVKYRDYMQIYKSNVYNEIFRRFKDKGFSGNINQIRRTSPIIPFVVNFDKFELYYNMDVVIKNKAFTFDKIVNIISLNHTEIKDKIVNPIFAGSYNHLYDSLYAVSYSIKEDTTSFYFHIDEEFNYGEDINISGKSLTDSELNNLLSLTNNETKYNEIKSNVNNKIWVVGIDFNGKEMDNRLKVYHENYLLTDSERSYLSELLDKDFTINKEYDEHLSNKLNLISYDLVDNNIGRVKLYLY